MHPALLTNANADAATTADVPEINFIRPIPGFSDLRHFALTRIDDREALISELRSLERPDVRFVVTVPAIFFSDYVVQLDDQDCEQLGLESAADALILTVLTPGENAKTTTANLLAPIVINSKTRAAAQVILTGTEWPVRAPLG
ncbi:flagellar assembly protein FliW [Kineosporia sp. NBRC 101731]|uniref:flagellar assembly protein FliW n=1 Tax=Kineosporia sp. NBRC 101731 TaxID=3032199 RepID=UPI00249F9817|nr:flagellar assembly protein FliW [Kineosporia sp. NBRC 101731]GLY27029.1 flagellar assembly factor FliW [Kineosporia sp. NBRC 101731]